MSTLASVVPQKSRAVSQPAAPRPMARGPTRAPPRPKPRAAPSPVESKAADQAAQAQAATQPHHWWILASLAAVALAVRLVEPLRSPIIAAEDPYLFMERTWNLRQGWVVWDYPVTGFMYLLSPFAALGPDAFYWIARFLPPLFGAAAVVGTFFLGRHGLGPWGGLAAATVIALLPEHIVRTNILFPTNLDMALLPWLLLLALRGAEGDIASLVALPAVGLAMLFVHPWFSALLLPPVGVFLLVRYVQRTQRVSVAAGAASVGVLGIFILINPVWSPWRMVRNRAAPRFMEIVQDPSTLWPLPSAVDLPAMLTIPVILLALAGTVVALVRRTPFALLALLWTYMLLPLVLVNWFKIWFIPHRTVAFMATGVAMLAAIAICEGGRAIAGARGAPRHKRNAVAAPAAMIAVALFMVPSAVTVEPWYRLFDEDDYAAWEEIGARGTTLVEAGSWETRAGYRALTGGLSEYYPGFFYDQNLRQERVKAYPDLVVVISDKTERDGLPTDFLKKWELVGEWGDVKAYTPPG